MCNSGRFLLTVIDATGDANKWEHDATREIFAKLQQANVPLAPKVPVFVSDLADLAEALKGPSSVVLIFAHGDAPPADPRTARKFWTGSLVQCWQLFAVSGIELDNKLVVLCVCSGFNQDAIDAVCNSTVGALGLVAPDAAIRRDEAVAFIPALLATLANASPSEINPDYVKTLVSELKDLARNKMKFRPAGDQPLYSIFGSR